jgi:hypothetical protein
MSAPKTFLKAFVFATLDAAKAKQFLTDHRLTVAEKKILEGYLKLRTSDFKWIEEQLSSVSSQVPWINSIGQLVIGIAKNNSGKADQALHHLHKAIEELRDCGAPEIHFLCVYNLFVTNHNLCLIEPMTKLYEESRQFGFPEGSAYWLRQQRLQFSFHSFTANHTEALRLLNVIALYESSMDEFQRLAWTVDKIRFFASLQNYDECYLELGKLKSMRNFYLSEDYKFIKGTLNFLSKDSPLYLYERDFSKIPVLSFQVQVLLCLESQNLSEAHKAWSELQKISPQVYVEEFQYHGEVCLFSLSVQKFLRKQRLSQVSIDLNSSALLTKEEKLFQVLKQYPDGISKTHLYEYIWGQSPETKNDLKKLSKLVERVKLKFAVEVQTRKGNYILKTDIKKQNIA